jgi:hypothetical protein
VRTPIPTPSCPLNGDCYRVGHFKDVTADSKRITAEELMSILQSTDAEQINLPDRPEEELISDEELRKIMDRSPKAYAAAQTGVEEAGRVFRPVADARDERSDFLA